MEIRLKWLYKFIHPFSSLSYSKSIVLILMVTQTAQVRKLEFLLAEALQTGSNCLITCGGLQSNFCRASAVAGRQLGLDTHLFLRCPGDKVSFNVYK